eukprot:scaffold2556_cov425-Prasinococcus_capsulatus_cf.AAC.5
MMRLDVPTTATVASLAFCNLAAAAYGYFTLPVSLKWEIDTTNNASGPHYGQPRNTAALYADSVGGVLDIAVLRPGPGQTYSQLRLYIVNHLSLQFMQLHIGCSDATPLTDLRLLSTYVLLQVCEFATPGPLHELGAGITAAVIFKHGRCALSGNGESVFLAGGDDDHYIVSTAPYTPLLEMPLLVALVSIDGELDTCSAGVCVHMNKVIRPDRTHWPRSCLHSMCADRALR